MRNKAIACLGAIVACATALAGIPATAMADDSAGLTPQYTYNSQNDNGMTFEKVSHADQGLSQADGVVDYTGDGTIAPYTAGLSTTGNGDRGQSYSYAAASSGDWVYIGTMYGGLGVQAILNRDMTSLGLTSKQATALIQTMYAGNMYLGEPDGKSAGGMLFKFNVKTGKTKILMSKSTGIDGGKGVIPTFRSAFKMNGKLYFEGMVMDTNNKDLTQQEIQTAMAYQNGFPCIYEVDPANNDKLTKVYDSVDVDGFRSLVKGNVFTSTRAIGSFGNTLIAGDLKPTADGKGKALLVASKTPVRSELLQSDRRHGELRQPARHPPTGCQRRRRYLSGAGVQRQAVRRGLHRRHQHPERRDRNHALLRHLRGREQGRFHQQGRLDLASARRRHRQGRQVLLRS